VWNEIAPIAFIHFPRDNREEQREEEKFELKRKTGN
jgi:hypothetical protein